MNTNENQFFELLKKQIAVKFLSENSAPDNIKDWKGDDITAFQEDLFSKVKAKVSEKWFYTYIKNDTDKLPRIDILNLLSQYVGYDNWYDLKKSNNHQIQSNKKPNYLKKIFWLLSLAAVSLFLFQFLNRENTFNFCFVDATKNEAITKTPLDIKILKVSESPLHFKTDSLGCFSYKSKDKTIRFVVQSPFHKTDTIVRHIDSNDNQRVELASNDYALMLHYYTSGNIKDWKKHKQNLNKLFADDAEIYQLFKNNIGVEIYTKEQFIRTLTIPTSKLKNMTVLDKTFKNGKIVKLKFMVR